MHLSFAESCNPQAQQLSLLNSKKKNSDSTDHVSQGHSASWFNSKLEGGTVPDGILTLLAATIGTGMLMIPNSMSTSGTIWSVIQMIFCAYMSYFSLFTVIKCANDIYVYSYQDLALQTYGHWCGQLVNITSFFANWGSIVLYLKLTVELVVVINGLYGHNTLPSWMIDPNSKILPVVIATIFILPISITKELKALRFFCLLNLFLVLYFCYVVLSQAIEYQPFFDSFQTTKSFILSGFSTTFPSAVFAFMSHTNVLDVFRELKEPSIKKMETIVRWTIGFVLITYVFVGLIGYATFSSNLDILSNVDISNGVILIAYGYTLQGFKRTYPIIVIICIISMCMSLVIAQPFNIKPAKDGLTNLFKPRSNASRDRSNESSFQRFIYVSITLYSAVFVVLFSESAQMIMNILGASFFSIICFTFPSMFYLKIKKFSITKSEKVTHIGMLVVSGIFAIWNTYANITNAFDLE